jgi:hypothetical protein
MNNLLLVLPFVIIIIILLMWIFRLKRDRNKVIISNPSEPIVQELLILSKKVKGIKNTTLVHSANYFAALGIKEEDIHNLEDEKKGFVINIDGDEIRLIVTHTCGSWSDKEIWKTIIQVEKTGGGTTYMEVLSPEDHSAVIKAIAAGKCNIATNVKNWP